MWQSLGAAYDEECVIKGIAPADCSLYDKLISDYRSTDLFWIISVCVIYMISCVVRAIRWNMLLRPLGYDPTLKNSFLSIMVGYFANLGLPRMGEFLRVGLFSRYEKIPYEKAFGTLVLGRLVDVLCLGLLILLGLALHSETMVRYITENSFITINMIIILIVVGVIGLIAGIWMYRRLISSDSQHPLLLKIKGLMTGFVEGLLSLKSVSNLPLFIVYSLGIWVIYVLMHWFAFLAFEPTAHLSFVDSILAFDFGALGMVFPSPGGMGSYHAMLVEALQILGVDEINGFSMAMISYFTINLFCNVFFGLLSLVLLPIVNK